jgi:hypothetical protein
MTRKEEVAMTALIKGTTSRLKKFVRSHRACIIVLLLLSVRPFSAVHAQQPPPPGDPGLPTLTPRTTAPMLADHRFTTTSAVRGPFVSTYFRNSIAVGMAPGSEIPLAVIKGEEITFETGDVMFSTLVLEYQQAVKDWMGFWVNFGLAGRLGTETSSLLSQGVTVVSGYRLGWLLRIMQSDNMALSGTVQVDNDGYTAVDLTGFVEGIIDDGLTEDDELVYSSSLMIAKTGLSYAWAIDRTTGLTASGMVGYGESPDRAAGSDWYFDLGAAVDFDLRREISLPIGAALGVRSTSIPESDLNLGNSLTTAAIRADYIGRHDLNIGLEIQSQWQDLRGSDKNLRYTIAAMDFRYYF